MPIAENMSANLAICSVFFFDDRFGIFRWLQKYEAMSRTKEGGSQLPRFGSARKSRVDPPHQLDGIIDRIPKCVFPGGRWLQSVVTEDGAILNSNFAVFRNEPSATMNPPRNFSRELGGCLA